MSQNTTKFLSCFYFKLTTCFGPCSGPSSGLTLLKLPPYWRTIPLLQKLFTGRRKNQDATCKKYCVCLRRCVASTRGNTTAEISWFVVSIRK